MEKIDLDEIELLTNKVSPLGERSRYSRLFYTFISFGFVSFSVSIRLCWYFFVLISFVFPFIFKLIFAYIEFSLYINEVGNFHVLVVSSVIFISKTLLCSKLFTIVAQRIVVYRMYIKHIELYSVALGWCRMNVPVMGCITNFPGDWESNLFAHSLLSTAVMFRFKSD